MAYKRKNHSNHSDSPYRKRFRPQSPDHDDESSLTTENETQARVDPTYGQRGAFPGLDDSNGEDAIFYGPASDGLEYLRMVRSEARTVPNLLVAPSQVQSGRGSNGFCGQGGDNTQGYYADGAYTITSLVPTAGRTQRRGGGSPDYDMEEEDADPQEAYYAALCTRFLRLRRLLHSTPAPSELLSNDESTALAASLYGAPHSKWRQSFLYTTPSMRVLALLEQESVIYGLQVMETLVTKRNLLADREGKNLGAWCWGLLGRCREVGEMMSEEVSVLRNVGKKALALRRKMGIRRAKEEVEEKDGEVEDRGEAEEEGEEVEAEEMAKHGTAGNVFVNDDMPVDVPKGNGDSEHENQLGDIHATNEATQAPRPTPPTIPSPTNPRSPNPTTIPLPQPADDPLHQAKLSLLADLRNSPPADHESTADQGDESRRVAEVYAALDMIVTVVGEMYGQRDLLEMREVWGEWE